MRIIDALRDREQARRLLDPGDHALFTGTPQQMERAMRERARHLRIASIVNNERLTEIPRAELSLEALGGRVIEHVASPNGDYFFPYFGDAGFVGDDVVAYFIREDETPIMLQRRHRPSSRAELEQMRAAREERKAAQAAAAKALNKQRRKELARK
jgi:hypothetical protein